MSPKQSTQGLLIKAARSLREWEVGIIFNVLREACESVHAHGEATASAHNDALREKTEKKVSGCLLLEMSRVQQKRRWGGGGGVTLQE